MAHQPLKMTIAETQAELTQAWTDSYSPETIYAAVEALSHKPVGPRVFHFIMRLGFRAIYFPQIGWRPWVKVIAQNRRTIIKLIRDGVDEYRQSRRNKRSTVQGLAQPT